jgi:hypothetical protein
VQWSARQAIVQSATHAPRISLSARHVRQQPTRCAPTAPPAGQATLWRAPVMPIRTHSVARVVCARPGITPQASAHHCPTPCVRRALSVQSDSSHVHPARQRTTPTVGRVGRVDPINSKIVGAVSCRTLLARTAQHVYLDSSPDLSALLLATPCVKTAPGRVRSENLSARRVLSVEIQSARNAPCAVPTTFLRRHAPRRVTQTVGHARCARPA